MFFYQRMVVAAAVVSACALAIGCSSDDEGSSTSSSGGSTSSSGGSTSTSSGSTSETCKTASLCLNGACKCTDGPNKDQSCEDGGTGADACDTLCKVCTSE